MINRLDFHPLANLFPMMDGPALETLKEDILANGLQEPITLFDGKIIDGRNCYLACEGAQLEPTFDVLEQTSPLEFVIGKNLHRRHLDELQRAMVAAKVAVVREESPPIGGLTAAAAAKTLNVGTRSVERAKHVLDKGIAELSRAVQEGKIAVSVAAKLADLPKAAQRAAVADPDKAPTLTKKYRRAVREKELGAKQKALPDARFGVIYADPPWTFEPYSRETGMDRAADNHYPVQKLSDIIAMDVQSIAADDCVLFLWATAPMIREALQVMLEWGFEYRSMVIWKKDRVGTGYWFRNKHEILLIGTRGVVPAPAPGEQWESVIDAAVAEHSAKPEIFAELIELYFPHLPRIELNRRGPARDGWLAHGLEAE